LLMTTAALDAFRAKCGTAAKQTEQAAGYSEQTVAAG